MATEKPIEVTKTKKTNPHQHLVDAISVRVQKIRSEWNTNSDSPRGRESLEVATLLEKATEALIESWEK
jgi:hypothetical protein